MKGERKGKDKEKKEEEEGEKKEKEEEEEQEKEKFHASFFWVIEGHKVGERGNKSDGTWVGGGQQKRITRLERRLGRWLGLP